MIFGIDLWSWVLILIGLVVGGGLPLTILDQLENTDNMEDRRPTIILDFLGRIYLLIIFCIIAMIIVVPVFDMITR